MSLQSGKVPANMKLAKVVPIYKAKEKPDRANYRPISLLPSTSKILEINLHCRLYKYFMKHELLSQNQFVFDQNIQQLMLLPHCMPTWKPQMPIS